MRIVFAHRFAPVQPGAGKVDLIHCRQMRFDGLQFRVADFFVRVRAVQAVNQNTRIRTQRILLHETGSVAGKAPNSKHQAPEKLQAPNKIPAVIEIWCLGFLWKLEVGAWSFSRVVADNLLE